MIEDEIKKIAIDAGADLNLQYKEPRVNLSKYKNGYTALMTCCKHYTLKNDTIIQMLISAGADVNIQDPHGLTALLIIILEIEEIYNNLDVVNRRNKIIELLIMHGAKVTGEQMEMMEKLYEKRDITQEQYNKIYELRSRMVKKALR